MTRLNLAARMVEPTLEAIHEAPNRSVMSLMNTIAGKLNLDPIEPLPRVETMPVRHVRKSAWPACVICDRRPFDCECDPDVAQQAMLARMGF